MNPCCRRSGRVAAILGALAIAAIGCAGSDDEQAGPPDLERTGGSHAGG